MTQRALIRLAWIPGLLLLGLALWLGRRDAGRPDPIPSPTPEEANRRAAPILQKIQQQLTATPAARLPDGPAIRLRSATIFPSAAPLNTNLLAHARPSARGYPWMVLFDGPVQPEWQSALEEAGAVIRSYLPDHALLIEARLDVLGDLGRRAPLAWVGEYLPLHKIQPLLAALARQEPDLSVPVTLQTFAPEDVHDIARQLQAAGAAHIRTTPAKRWGLVRAMLPARAVMEMAQRPEVQWIEHRATPRLLNDQALASNRLNVAAARDQYGLDGSGQIVAIADTGLDTGKTNTLHPDFEGRLLHVFDIGRLTNWSDTYYHGTHVAASFVGTGAASGGQYRGAAPAAQLVFQSFLTASLTLAAPDDLNELYLPPYEFGARIHSDSWGSAVDGAYDSDAMTTDEFIWDNPDMLVTYAAGNAGTDADRDGVVDTLSLNSPGSAKNVLTVGASESGRPPGSGGRTASLYGSSWAADFRTPPISTDLISSSPNGNPQGIVAFSSRGPAADGRIKPDVVAPGSDIVSARSRASSDTGWGVLAANTNYCFLGGTSMATPLVAGAATLVRQYCAERLGLPNPSAALLKAALVGGARSLSPGQYGTNEFREIPPTPRPNNVEGWGQTDLTGTLFPPAGMQAVLMEGSAALPAGSSHAFDFYVHDSAPLTVVMAYSDYPSALAAAVNLVNDLDLLLLDPAGTPYHPNGLDGPDSLNNVEGIDVAAAATGRWTLAVSAPNVPEGPQPYGLYLRGAIWMPIQLDHEPLANTFDTSGDYLITAEASSVAGVDPDTIRLHWNITGSSNEFTTVTMLTTNGRVFTAAIPAQPVHTRVFYYLSAGPAEFPAFHPPAAPAEYHAFDVTIPLSLTIGGSPSNSFTAQPDYGEHILASNTAVSASASYPLAGTNGWRTACIGWQGTGAVPPAGPLDFVDFRLTADSTLTWLWQDQVALMHTSSPYGAIGAVTWHPVGETASSLIATESHVFNNVPLTFAGWTVDGSRWPDPNAPSPLQIHAIPMPVPRLATATYVPTAQDNDANGLPDWFELRHYGQLGQNRYGDPDDDGYENELEAADHTDPFDNASVPAPPVIGHEPLHSPAAAPAPWPIAATVTDNYRVASATLHWQRNGGLWRSSPMSNAAPDLFTAHIPSPALDGDQIAYYISAADAAGFNAQSVTWTVNVTYARMAFSPPAVALAAPAGTVTNATLVFQNTGSQALDLVLEITPVGFFDDVESGTNGWTRPDGKPDWHISTHEAHSPDHAWYCGQELTRTYRNSTHAALVSPPIQLAAGAPRLDFMHWAGFEIDQDEWSDGIHYWDAGILEITDNDGLTWQSLVPEGGYPGLITSNNASPFAPETPCFVDTVGWEPVGADLAAYAGRQIRLRFRFGADLYTIGEGWRLDDIAVSPRTEFAEGLALAWTNTSLAAGMTNELTLTLDTAFLPPMASGHWAIAIHHNDPEKASPIVVPVALHNTTRRVRVTTDGPGEADPAGESLVQEAQPFAVDFTAAPCSFIADIRTNSMPTPLPEVVATQNFSWTSLSTNLDIHAVFAPILEDGLVPLDWLALYGLTNRHWMAEASLDQDGDGLLTWQEYQLGSDPTDPADARLVVNFVPNPHGSNAWRVTWHAFTNRAAIYDVLGSTNIVEGFVAFTNLPAAPPVMTSPPLPPNYRVFGLRRH